MSTGEKQRARPLTATQWAKITDQLVALSPGVSSWERPGEKEEAAAPSTGGSTDVHDALDGPDASWQLT